MKKIVKLLPAVLLDINGKFVSILPLTGDADKIEFNNQVFEFYPNPNKSFRIFMKPDGPGKQVHPKIIQRIAQVAILKDRKRRFYNIFKGAK